MWSTFEKKQLVEYLLCIFSEIQAVKIFANFMQHFPLGTATVPQSLKPELMAARSVLLLMSDIRNIKRHSSTPASTCWLNWNVSWQVKLHLHNQQQESSNHYSLLTFFQLLFWNHKHIKCLSCDHGQISLTLTANGWQGIVIQMAEQLSE